jgi:serine/threonine protein kinase
LLKIGTTVSKRFVIRHLLAEGGMAEVYLAQTPENEQVVLKRLKPNLPHRKRDYQLFVDEANLIIKLIHPNIVRGFELIEEGSDDFLVMEHIVGKPVEQLINQQFSALFRAQLAVAVGIQTCQALDYAFKANNEQGQPLKLVHKDISPQNLIVAATGLIKIIDFGVAQTAFNQNDDRETLRGNIHYMSPEQIEGNELNQASDVYSLALVMLEIVRGKKWRPEESDADLFCSVKNNEVNGDLLETLKKALVENAPDRIQSCEALLLLLRKIQHQMGFEPGEILNESLSLIAKFQQPNAAKWVPVLSHIVRLSSLSCALVVIILMLFCIAVELFRPHLTLIGPVANSDGWELNNPEKSELHESEPAWGQLSVIVFPPAEIYIGDQFYGSTPMGDLSLPPGEYIVQLRRPNYSTIALRRVKIYADKRTELIHNF